MKKAQKNRGYSHILKYTGLFGGVQGLNILVGLVRNKLVAEILGPSGTGLISLFNSTINLVSNSTNLGIPVSAVKNISEAFDNDREEEMRRIIAIVRSWSLVTAVVGVVLFAVLSPLFSKWTIGWGNHTLHFVLLSPIVGMMAVTGGEMAILKGMRRLKSLAMISIYFVVVALFISVPLYYFFGESAIVPSLFIMAMAQMMLTIGYSWKVAPLNIRQGFGRLADGTGMVRLGVAFVLAGVLGSGADFLIRSFLSNRSSLETVGLYSAGYMMVMTYVSMVFSALETDFFPRLSASNNLTTTTNTIVNRQIEVSLLLISPLLVFLTISLPILLPLLYSGRYTPVIGMMQIMVSAMYFRAIKLPIAYLPLAKGDSYSYLFLEAVYDVMLVTLVVLSFGQWGLTGCGVAITAAGILDFFFIFFYTRMKYGYRISANVVRYACFQLPFGILAFLVTFVDNALLYWTTGALLSMASLAVSLFILRQKTSLWDSLKQKLFKRGAHE